MRQSLSCPNDNRHRSIIFAKGGHCWVYEYLYAKQDRDNIDADELPAFRVLAKSYAELSDEQIADLIQQKFFVEICNDNQTKVPERGI